MIWSHVALISATGLDREAIGLSDSERSPSPQMRRKVVLHKLAVQKKKAPVAKVVEYQSSETTLKVVHSVSENESAIQPLSESSPSPETVLKIVHSVGE